MISEPLDQNNSRTCKFNKEIFYGNVIFMHQSLLQSNSPIKNLSCCRRTLIFEKMSNSQCKINYLIFLYLIVFPLITSVHPATDLVLPLPRPTQSRGRKQNFIFGSKSQSDLYNSTTKHLNQQFFHESPDQILVPNT